MRLTVIYALSAVSSKEKTGKITTFAQLEEGNSLSETCDNAENGDTSGDDSIMPPLIIEEEIDKMSSGDESDAGPMSTEMLEDIIDSCQYHPQVHKREGHYKIHDCIKKIQSDWKRALIATQKMAKGLHRVFKIGVKEISKDSPTLGESGSEVSYFIQEPRNFAEMIILSDEINRSWPKSTQN